MSRLVEVLIPDIGDDGEVDVIEVLVNEGDTVEVEQSLVNLESDKAAVEVPSSHAGVGKERRLKVGDTASEGTVILELEEAEAAAGTDKDVAADFAPEQPAATRESAAAASTA